MADEFHLQTARCLAGAGLIAATLLGCESPEWTKSLNDSFSSKEVVTHKVEEEHRQVYVESHSRKSMRWLLSHCVQSGMSYDEVCKVMGENGTPEPHDQSFKSRGGGYHVDVEMYCWKDDEGHAIYLGFREDRLVNFDRAEFR